MCGLQGNGIALAFELCYEVGDLVEIVESQFLGLVTANGL